LFCKARVAGVVGSAKRAGNLKSASRRANPYEVAKPPHNNALLFC